MARGYGASGTPSPAGVPTAPWPGGDPGASFKAQRGGAGQPRADGRSSPIKPKPAVKKDDDADAPLFNGPSSTGSMPDPNSPQSHEERLRTHLEWLQKEHEFERRKLNQSSTELAEFEEQERGAHMRAEKQRRDVHQQRKIFSETELKIKGISEALTKFESPGQSSRWKSAGSGILAGCVRNAERFPSRGSAVGFGSRGSIRGSIRCDSAASKVSADSKLSADSNDSNPKGARTSSMQRSSMRRSVSTPDTLTQPKKPPEEDLGAVVKSSEEPSSPPGNTTLLSNEDLRHSMRLDIIEKAGGDCWVAFRKFDLNGSGSISLMEFQEGLTSLGTDNQRISNNMKVPKLFKVLDMNKDGVLTYDELFPEDGGYRPVREIEKPDTPRFWKTWCKNNKMEDYDRKCVASWLPATHDAELDVLLRQSEMRNEANQKHKWMSATMRRLKSRGKSDARCREIVALHLPKGSGPLDLSGVKTLSKTDVHTHTKEYMDSVHDSVKNAQQVVYDMREQRRVLQGYRQQLYQVAMEPMIRAEQERNAQNAAKDMGLASMLGKVKDTSKDDDKKDTSSASKRGSTMEPIGESGGGPVGKRQSAGNG